MAKKREWKAWMIVNERGQPRTEPKFKRDFLPLPHPPHRIIRVRITEDK